MGNISIAELERMVSQAKKVADDISVIDVKRAMYRYQMRIEIIEEHRAYVLEDIEKNWNDLDKNRLEKSIEFLSLLNKIKEVKKDLTAG